MTNENSAPAADSTTHEKPDAALVDKIIKQIEYYFGDINLSKDKFMQEELQKDSGWVQLETLVKFNRLKSLSTDFQVILDSLKQSTSNLLEIDEENKKVRRVKALPENLSEFETTLKQNTVYVKGFPTTTTLDELYQFFEPHGKLLQVFMRRFPATKQFKGSVFVTFETSEQMKTFLEQTEVKHQETVLTKESQEDYFKRKGPLLNSIKESKQKKEQEKLEKKKQQEEAEEAFMKEQKLPGSVLYLKGLNSEGTRENLKEVFDNFVKVKWIDYNKGEPEAYIRFAEADKAKEALESALKAGEGEIKLRGAKLEARVLEGDEEETFWKGAIKKLIEDKRMKLNKRKHQNSRQKGGNNKRDYKSKRDRGDNNGDAENGKDEHETPNKKQKVDAEPATV